MILLSSPARFVLRSFSNVATFEKDLKTNLAGLDNKIIKAQMPYYPAGNCIVMDDEKMTDPRGEDAMKDKNVVIGNRLYRFCCKALQQKR